MAWSATVVGKSISGSSILVVVEFTDGARVFQENFALQNPLDAQAVRRSVEQRLVQLVKLDALNAAITVGQNITPVPAPPPPTQAQIDRDAWFVDYQKLQSLLRLVATGLLAATDAQVTNLQADLVLRWKNSYLSSI